MLPEESPDTTSPMDLITAQGESTAFDQLGHAAIDRRLTPEKRDMDSQSEASLSLGTDRSQCHAINITRLPQEILSGIFGFFQHPATDGKRIDLESIKTRFSKDQHKDIQNLRLVCQLFNTLASTLLVPVIRVEVDQPSLDRVLALLKNPLIAAGVLAIQVNLRYHFNVLAVGFLDFIRYRTSDTHLWEDYFLQLRSSELRNAELSGQPVPQEVLERNDLMCQRSRAFAFACLQHIGEQSPQHLRLKTVDDAQLVEQYYRIIRVAYENYKIKYHDQHRIATEKLLVKALAKLVSLASRRVCLSISDGGCNRDRGLFPDNQTFSKQLEAPDGWSDFRPLREKPIEVDLVSQLSIIWDLPIAIHEAGGVLDGFELQHLVADKDHRGYRMLCPESLSPGGHDLDRLRAACQHLTRFRFGGLQHRKHPNESASRDWQIGNTSITDFLQSILSSRQLEEVDMSEPSKTCSHTHLWRDSRLLGNVISNLHCAHLRTVSLVKIGMSQRQMLRMFQGLGLKIRLMSLDSVWLTDGSWAQVLDALRRAFNRPGLRSRPRISMTRLKGGNTAMLRKQLADANATVEGPSTPSATMVRAMDLKLMELFQAYITSDQETANPGLGNSEQ
ncbi:unnamed protein product [Clonostachys solani]|uniref:Uncharacterized protein n=1 Tax=Clonostachys solani TaxID=160281 RepID=A0A9N9W313_9HYPO|nr:unnamed protein product [Clonostachys solani]